MEPIFWTGVQVDGQTALGSAVAITGISKATEGVVTKTSHGLSTGDYVVLDVTGMIQVNRRAFRITALDADTFKLDGEDTSDYRTFVSGNYREITFGVSAATLQDVNVSGGEPNFTPTTTIHDLEESDAPTTTSKVQITHTSMFSASDPFLKEMRRAHITKTRRVLRYTFTNGDEVLVNAYVSAAGAPTGSSGQVVQTPLSLSAQGAPTVVPAAA